MNIMSTIYLHNTIIPFSPSSRVTKPKCLRKGIRESKSLQWGTRVTRIVADHQHVAAFGISFNTVTKRQTIRKVIRVGSTFFSLREFFCANLHQQQLFSCLTPLYDFFSFSLAGGRGWGGRDGYSGAILLTLPHHNMNAWKRLQNQTNEKTSVTRVEYFPYPH